MLWERWRGHDFKKKEKKMVLLLGVFNSHQKWPIVLQEVESNDISIYKEYKEIRKSINKYIQ